MNGNRKTILVTGGAGYIGSHILVELSDADYDVIVYDNLDNSSIETLYAVRDITEKGVVFVQGDIRDKETLNEVFDNYDIDSVIHLAGLKAVGESVAEPLKYYDNNVSGTVTLLQVMKEHNCKEIVFSSSATVYGDPREVPIPESAPLRVTNPYGMTKLHIEDILNDVYVSDNFKVVILRYFNPIGAHESGLIGENPKGTPNNLMPYIAQVASGNQKELKIFGDDYDTKDGTGVRDYLHVVDLAKGHVKALDKMVDIEILTVNLGTGKGYSVLELVETFEKVNNLSIPYSIQPRRDGDIAACYADSSYAKKVLDWEATKTIEDMCRDAWNYQKRLI